MLVNLRYQMQSFFLLITGFHLLSFGPPLLHYLLHKINLFTMIDRTGCCRQTSTKIEYIENGSMLVYIVHH